MISSACDRFARSNRRARGRVSPTATGPACAPDSSATAIVSRTVRSAKSRACWNDRPSPSAARRCGLARETSWPSSTTDP